MASVENALSLLLVEYLRVNSYYEEFAEWFLEAPLPFSYKVILLKKMEGNNVLIKTNFPSFWKDLEELQRFRNVLAHSFDFLGDTITSKGRVVPTEDVTFEALMAKLDRLRKLEDTIRYMYDYAITGTPPPHSADDFADWPL